MSQLLSTRVDKSLTKGLSAVGLAAMCAEPAAAHAVPLNVDVTVLQLLQDLNTTLSMMALMLANASYPSRSRSCNRHGLRWGRLAAASALTSCSVWC